MPGAVGRTSTYALCNVTLPYVLQLARHGWRSLAAADPGVAEGVNIDQGRVTNQAVAATFGLPLCSRSETARPSRRRADQTVSTCRGLSATAPRSVRTESSRPRSHSEETPIANEPEDDFDDADEHEHDHDHDHDHDEARTRSRKPSRKPSSSTPRARSSWRCGGRTSTCCGSPPRSPATPAQHRPLKPGDLKDALQNIWDIFSEFYAWIDPEEAEDDDDDEDEDDED